MSDELNPEAGGDTAGETLPTVLVPVERSLIQKLRGTPRNQLAETIWTLVAYPGPGKTA